ncbi:MAG: SDR family oxidoreductase [SAR202 cluster bacterium]|nr:SDR family oxidoreductase [SAR202 cluster bacterium]|tara:strand:+ start:29543 stop:30340 length:798 start_codon:yes stop_codon:yes gene_type:complete
MDLKGKNALITGSKQGIGKAIAIKLASEGCNVGVNDIVKDEFAIATIKALEKYNVNVSWHKADVAVKQQTDQMIEDFVNEHSGIDILINNAVSSIKKPFLEISEQDWEFEVGNALKGYLFCSQTAAKEMIKSNRPGRIVSISSVHSFAAAKDNTVYGICKAGINRMTMNMAQELGQYNIICNAIAPGYIDSRELPKDQEYMRAGEGYADNAKQYIPIRIGGVPDNIANMAVALCTSVGNYVNGQTITIDGGLLTGFPVPDSELGI